MKIEQRDGLLFVPVTISHNGITKTIPDLVLDTGAAQSIIDMSAITDLDLGAERGDEFVFLTGIGGEEPALRKYIDRLQFGTHSLDSPLMDFAYLPAHPGINGLLGADILLSGRFIIDLDQMEVYQR